MNRRDFFKTTIGMAASMAVAPSLFSLESGMMLPLDDVEFSGGSDAQTLIIYLMGGMGEIIANMSNFDELKTKDTKYNDYLNIFNRTSDGEYWVEAGGEFIKEMVDDGNATIFRTCLQKDTLRAHLLNQIRNMRGNDVGYDSGMVSTLMHILGRNESGILNSLMPNVSFVDSNFQLMTDGGTRSALSGALKPVSLPLTKVSNPFKRKGSAVEVYANYPMLDDLSNQMNKDAKLNPLIGQMFANREQYYSFVEKLLNSTLPEGIDYRSEIKGTVRYDDFNFGRTIEAAMRIMVMNPDTRVVSMTTQSWDDHSNALSAHRDRGYYLFKAIKTAMDHAKAAGRENINIILFGDFGRNMMINSALGWDHGNNQNFMWFGGKKSVNHLGIVGETKLTGSYGRIFTLPTDNSYTFEPYAIAATFYKLYGVKNPEILTGGRKAIGDDALGVEFVKGT